MTVSGWPAVVVLLGLAALVLGVPLGLYWLLTRKQRAVVAEIRRGVEECGWKFALRRWAGDFTAFRIDGRDRSGRSFTVKSYGTDESNRGWAVVLALRFPQLAGEPDFGVLPRKGDRGDFGGMAARISPEMQKKIEVFSGTAAGAIALMRDGKEMPSGEAGFDAAYRVMALPGVFREGPVGVGLGEKIMKWPADAVAAHSILAWRDPFGLHVQARLPGAANWGTICYGVEIGEELADRIPAGRLSGEPRGVADRAATWFLGRRS